MCVVFCNPFISLIIVVVVIWEDNKKICPHLYSHIIRNLVVSLGIRAKYRLMLSVCLVTKFILYCTEWLVCVKSD